LGVERKVGLKRRESKRKAKRNAGEPNSLACSPLEMAVVCEGEKIGEEITKEKEGRKKRISWVGILNHRLLKTNHSWRERKWTDWIKKWRTASLKKRDTTRRPRKATKPRKEKAEEKRRPGGTDISKPEVRRWRECPLRSVGWGGGGKKSKKGQRTETVLTEDDLVGDRQSQKTEKKEQGEKGVGGHGSRWSIPRGLYFGKAEETSEKQESL